ncbi:MAG: nicotinate-nucleotide--dimethylbenzimidazole phosphoribosyltransferase [Pseudomonadota bacterium]
MLDHLAIAPPAAGLENSVATRIAGKAMPSGALAGLSDLAAALALSQNTETPAADPAHLLIFAGDHGLVAEGVSAWPQSVTALMVETFLSGRAAAPVLARSVGAKVTVCDAGVAGPLAPMSGLVQAGIRPGTRNAAVEDALTPAELAAALAFGADQAQAATRNGARVILLGEMGIGNTASAALLGSAIAGIPLETLVGPGAGVGPEGLAPKRAALARAQARHPGHLTPEEALAAFGGLEIAAMAGAIIGGASAGAAVLVDGFIATAAALSAITARPEARRCCLFAHRGAEPGHAALLTALDARPPLDLGLRLGEGTGALLALPLLRAGAAMLNEMASLADLGLAPPP